MLFHVTSFAKNDSHRPAVGYLQHHVLTEQIEIDVVDEVSLHYCQLHDDEDVLDVPWDVVIHVEHNDDYGVVGEDAPDSRILSLLWCNNTDVGNWVLENVDQEAAAVRSSLHVAAEVDSILKHIRDVCI